jgi:anti-anti-sigma factor
MDPGDDTEELHVRGPRFLSEVSSDPSGVPLIALHGELDMSSADELRDTVDQVAEHRPRQLIFDMSELDFVDSSGIAVLVYAANTIGDVHLQNSSPLIRRVLEASGLSTILRDEPSD